MMLLAQAEVGSLWTQLAIQMPVVAVVVLVGWFLYNENTKQAKDFALTAKAIQDAHQAFVEKRDKEWQAFLEHASAACHTVHESSIAAMTEVNRTLGRALSILDRHEKLIGPGKKQLGPSDTQIARDNEAFENQQRGQ